MTLALLTFLCSCLSFDFDLIPFSLASSSILLKRIFHVSSSILSCFQQLYSLKQKLEDLLILCDF